MNEVPYEAGANVRENLDETAMEVREFFDQKGYVRIRIRKRDGKETKVRNLRALTNDRNFANRVAAFLKAAGAKPLIYSIGKSYCVDIEGKARLEAFLRKVGLEEGKRTELEEALKPLSLSKREGMV